MISKIALRGEIDRKIANRSIHTNFNGRPYYHLGDYEKKSTANEVAQLVREISAADIAFGQRGYLVRVSGAYFSHINDKAKYGVYVARGKQRSS